MNLKTITVGDCIKAYTDHGMTVKIENGSVLGFEKEKRAPDKAHATNNSTSK